MDIADKYLRAESRYRIARQALWDISHGAFPDGKEHAEHVLNCLKADEKRDGWVEREIICMLRERKPEPMKVCRIGDVWE